MIQNRLPMPCVYPQEGRRDPLRFSWPRQSKRRIREVTEVSTVRCSYRNPSSFVSNRLSMVKAFSSAECVSALPVCGAEISVHRSVALQQLRLVFGGKRHHFCPKRFLLSRAEWRRRRRPSCNWYAHFQEELFPSRRRADTQ